MDTKLTVEKQLKNIRTASPKIVPITLFCIGLIELQYSFVDELPSTARLVRSVIGLLIVSTLIVYSVILVRGHLTVRRLMYARWIGASVCFVSIIWISSAFGLAISQEKATQYLPFVYFALCVCACLGVAEQVRVRCRGFIDQYIDVGRLSRRGFISKQEAELLLYPHDAQVLEKEAYWRSKRAVLSGVGVLLAISLSSNDGKNGMLAVICVLLLAMVYALTVIAVNIFYFHRHVENPDALIRE